MTADGQQIGPDPGGRPRRANVLEVARLAGVSAATVSRVMNGTARVAEVTAQRVQAAIETLAYQPAPQARHLRTGKSGNIALIVPSITNPFFPELVASLHTEVAERGYALLLVDSAQPEAEAWRVARARLADGIIIVGSAAVSSARALLAPPDVPVVAIDRRPAGLAAPIVQVDNFQGARDVVRHLGAAGHRRIGFIGGPRGMTVSADRARGYRAALRELGADAPSGLVTAGGFDEDSGYAAMGQLLATGLKITAVFAANDIMAIGAMSALRERGIAVPGQVAVAGFDGINLGRYVVPSLTTYAQPIAQLARSAVQNLAAGIGAPDRWHPERDAAPGRALKLRGEVVIRDSTITPRSR